MTETSSATDERAPEAGRAAGDDQRPYPFGYGHGRMPLFLKLAWTAVIAFMTWYVVSFLLTSLGAELGK